MARDEMKLLDYIIAIVVVVVAVSVNIIHCCYSDAHFYFNFSQAGNNLSVATDFFFFASFHSLEI